MAVLFFRMIRSSAEINFVAHSPRQEIYHRHILPSYDVLFVLPRESGRSRRLARRFSLTANGTAF